MNSSSVRPFWFVAAVAAVMSAALSWPQRVQSQQPAGEASQAAPATGAGSASSRLRYDERYRIGPADVLEVRVFERPQLSRDNVRVDGNGYIRLPLVDGEIVAACLSESELGAVVANRYREYLKNPQVDVFVKDFSSEPVAVVGAVMKPGSFQLERRVRLRELITLAGGPSPSSGQTVQIVHDDNAPACDNAPKRPLQQVAMAGGSVPLIAAAGEPEQVMASADSQVMTVDLGALMRGASINPFIRPGDFVSIPNADQIFVVGNVVKPSAIDLKQPLTLSRAVAMAGGTLPSTKRSSVHIIRASTAGNVETTYDLGKIEQHAAPDPLLTAGDIVDVPTSLGKQILRGTFTMIAPAYAIYGPLTLIH